MSNHKYDKPVRFALAFVASSDESQYGRVTRPCRVVRITTSDSHLKRAQNKLTETDNKKQKRGKGKINAASVP
jgi:hypothetical protein